MKTVLRASLLAVTAAMVAGCHGTDSASPAVVETVQARVVESQVQEVPVNLRSTGTVHAKETAVLSAQVMGRIQQVLVHEGDSVRAGQTLVVLDDAALRAALEQAQARPEGGAKRASCGADQRLIGDKHVEPVQAT